MIGPLKMTSLKLIAGASALLVLASCNAGKNQPNIELVQNMMDQVSVKAQDWDPNKDDFSTGRIPPEGTVPVGYKPYKYKGDALGAQKNLKNPHGANKTAEFMSLGQKHYVQQCLVCHGATGAGDGKVASKMMLKPPSLLTEKINDYNDARIYHIVTDGQGVMGSYYNQIRHEKDRWAVVNYVRSLQRKAKQ